MLDDDIFLRKCFSQSLLENVEVFKTVGERAALISCIAMWLYAFCVPIPILSKCGALYSFITVRSFHNLLTNKRKSTPHFLFYIINRVGVERYGLYK